MDWVTAVHSIRHKFLLIRNWCESAFENHAKLNWMLSIEPQRVKQQHTTRAQLARFTSTLAGFRTTGEDPEPSLFVTTFSLLSANRRENAPTKLRFRIQPDFLPFPFSWWKMSLTAARIPVAVLSIYEVAIGVSALQFCWLSFANLVLNLLMVCED